MFLRTLCFFFRKYIRTPIIVPTDNVTRTEITGTIHEFEFEAFDESVINWVEDDVVVEEDVVVDVVFSVVVGSEQF